LTEQRVNPAGVPAYMLTHPLTEDRVSHVETTSSAQKLKTPSGRPAATSELAEVQAVARAIADPPDVVIPRYRRLAEEKPDDAERQFLLGRVYQTVGQLEAGRARASAQPVPADRPPRHAGQPAAGGGRAGDRGAGAAGARARARAAGAPAHGPARLRRALRRSQALT